MTTPAKVPKARQAEYLGGLADEALAAQDATKAILSADEADERMAAQMEQAEKAELADYVIDNGGTLEAGREATRIVCEQLQLDLMRWMAGSPLGPAG